MPRKMIVSDAFTADCLQAREATNSVRQREMFEASIHQGMKDLHEGRVFTLREAKIKLGSAPPLVGVLAHPCNVRKG